MTGVARSICVATALVVFAGRVGTAAAEPPATAAAPPPLEVTADTPCPRADATGRVLGEILGLSAAEHLSEVARLAYADGGLVVTLRDSEGHVLGARTLPLEGSCDELARAAAVVLATWLGDVHPEFVPRLAQRANAAPAAAPPSANGSDAAEGASGTNAPNGPSSGKAGTGVTPPSGSVRSSGSVQLEPEWRLRASAAVGASVLPAPVAFAGTLSGVFVPNHGGVGATLRASAVTSRERDVPGGKVRYFRWPLAAGATLRFAAPSVALELDGGGALAWLHVAGRSFSPDRSADDATIGTFAAARVLGTRGPILPFAELAGLFWLRSARVYADAAQPSVALPRGELTLSAGVAFVP